MPSTRTSLTMNPEFSIHPTIVSPSTTAQRNALMIAPLGEQRSLWPAPGSEDTELGVLMELEVGHGETEVHA